MAKFDFNNSRYAKFFKDKTNQRFLQTFLNQEGVLYTNYDWYLSQGRKADNATPVSPDGTAAFTAKCRATHAAPLMDMRAPLGDSNQMDAEGLDFYTGTVPDFIAPGYVETAAERMHKEAMYEEFGSDADIIAAWLEYVQKQVDSGNATMSNMTAQIMSTGVIDYSTIGRGVRLPICKAPIPTDNFVTAGEKVWTDSTARLLDQMKDIEEAYRDKRGYTGALIWQVPRDMFFKVILANTQVKELVESWKANPQAWVAHTGTETPTEAIFRFAVQDYNGLSPIQIVEEKQRNITHATDTFVHGWKQNVAVLRPAGDAVEFQYVENFDKKVFEKYGAKTITKVFSPVLNGMGMLVNTTLNNGSLQEWHTDVMLSAIPTLIEFPDHLIVDTQTANA